MTETDKKRLLYRASYRGFKEADILLGGFLRENMQALSDSELADFEILLEARDHDIYDWISGAKPVPKAYDTPVFAKLITYKPVF